MNTGDATYIKKMNRLILIEELIQHMTLSRSELSRKTGLNKATVSAQVQDLLDENIFIEKAAGETTSRGRKPIILEINGRAGYSIGIDIDEEKFFFIFSDLKGRVFHRQEQPLKNTELSLVSSEIIGILHPLIQHYNDLYTPHHLVGIGIGVHGIVNRKNEIIYTPKEKWIKENITQYFEEAFNVDTHVDNNANLSVFAEQVYSEYISDLFCVTLYTGIGLGIIKNHEIYRGFQGFAGEIGHMIIETNGIPCTCGNLGCWELYASDKALKKKLASVYPLYSDHERLQKMFDHGGYNQYMDEYLLYLAVGLNNIINIFNPEKLILNSPFLNVHPELIKKVEEKLQSKFNNYQEIRVSTLGNKACALGASALALKKFLGVNTLIHANYHYQI